MQDRPASSIHLLALLGLVVLGTSGCTERGDLGREQPSFITKTAVGGFSTAKDFLGLEEVHDLPLTAAEDALRSREQMLKSMQFTGIISQVIRPRSGDGFVRVSAITLDLQTDRGQFASFVTAARKVMQIDAARHKLLSEIDTMTARRQSPLARKRRGKNDWLIRNGVRSMRQRSKEYLLYLKRLPIEWPNVPLTQVQAAYELFHEDIVRFHGEIDARAHEQLGQRERASYK